MTMPSLSVAPATPADAQGNIFGRNARPSRQRSLSDAAVPNYHGIDPRMLEPFPSVDFSSAPSYSPALSDSALEVDDFQGRESSIGPRRRSAAAAWAEPYAGARQQRHQIDIEMQRGRSHQRNAYSEDLTAHMAAAGGSAFLPVDAAAVYAEHTAQYGVDPRSAATTSSMPNSPFLPGLPPPSNNPNHPGFIPYSDPMNPMGHMSALPRHLGGRGRRPSDAGSPTRSSTSSAASDNGGDIVDDPVHWDSQTTIATKLAANARRKPGTDAKFICDYCGESASALSFSGSLTDSVAQPSRGSTI